MIILQAAFLNLIIDNSSKNELINIVEIESLGNLLSKTVGLLIRIWSVKR